MGKTSKPSNDPQFYEVKIKYDPDFDHFEIQGSFTFTRPVLCVDGFDAYKKLRMYLDGFYHEVEALKRASRRVKNEETNKEKANEKCSEMSQM